MRVLLCLLLLSFAAGHAYPGTGIPFIYSYPQDKAVAVHPNSAIGITFSEAIRNESLIPSVIRVESDAEKKYSGTLKLSDNKRTVIFTPSDYFSLGEIIRVHLGALETVSGGRTIPVEISFTIRKKIAVPDPNFHSDDPILEQELHPAKTEIKQSPFFSTENMPDLNIIINAHPSDGNIYMASHSPPGAMIIDKKGTVISLIQNMGTHYDDFKPYTNGTYSYFNNPASKFLITDTNFSVIDTVLSRGIYICDGHEIRKTSEGNYIIIGTDYVPVDMREYIQGGDSAAVIIDPAILIYDTRGNLLWQWRAIDHFLITDATYENLLANSIDFCHINAIEFDADSNLIISSRHMDEITKINRVSGNIIWRWGGKNNQFSLAGDTLPFSHQHGIRRTPAGTYTMFDNGNFRSSGVPFSRAVEYRLDQENKIATKIWEFRHTPDVYGSNMGYVQRLQHNSTLIDWGSCDSASVTEIDSNNITQLEMVLANGNYTYRAYKYDAGYIRQNSEGIADQSSLFFSMTPVSCIPNPITNSAKIECTVANDGYANLSLYDALGREASKIYSGFLLHGDHEFALNSGSLSAGEYYVTVRSSGHPPARMKIIILK